MRVKARQLLKRDATCTTCGAWIDATDDGADGVWISCDCDAGYVKPGDLVSVFDLEA